MSWRDRPRPASFRGVGFLVDSHQHDFGRRTDVHEYALRATPWVEDLGRQGRRYSLDAYLLGPDYDLSRAELIRALETEGPGTLVHPWLGSVIVTATTSSLSETIRRGGEASFRLDFVEAGENTTPDAGDDTVALAASAADAAGQQAADGLGQSFSVAGQPGFVLDGATAQIEAVTEALDQALAPVRAASADTAAWLRRADRVRTEALALARMPADMATELLDLTRDAVRLAGTPRAVLASLRPLLDFGSTLTAVLGLTPARQRERANRDRMVLFLRQAAAAEATRAVSRITFAAYDEAAAIRDDLAEAMDAIADAAADLGDDAAYDAVQTLRLAMVRDVTARGGSLTRLFDHRVTTDRPLLVIAHELYGDADRDQEIAARNRIRHPGFVLAGTVLKALDGGRLD